MFRLVTVEEVVQVPPRLFGLPRFEAMEHEIHRKYSNKVLSGIGVCVALWDWISAGDHRLVPQTGDSNTRCRFRMLVFAPFQGETLWGYVNRVSEEGIDVDIDFMGGITIPKAALPDKSTFDKAERAWRIRYGADDPEDDVEVMLDVGNSIAFSVLRINFTDGIDKPPEDPKKESKSKPVMTLKASMKNQGLGRYEWWATAEAEEEEDEEGGEEGEEGGEGEVGEGEDEEYGDAGGEEFYEDSGEHNNGDGAQDYGGAHGEAEQGDQDLAMGEGGETPRAAKEENIEAVVKAEDVVAMEQ